MNKSGVTVLLSLSRRERIEVRDDSARVLQALTKSHQERCRALRGLDGSKNDRVLSPEFVVGEAPILKVAPQNTFAVDRVLTERTGASHWGIV